MKKLKLGVIGLGSRGYGMMRRIAKHPDIEVRYIDCGAPYTVG